MKFDILKLNNCKNLRKIQIFTIYLSILLSSEYNHSVEKQLIPGLFKMKFVRHISKYSSRK